MDNHLEKIKNNPLSNKTDVLKLIEDLCQPLLPFYSEGKTRIKINHFSAVYTDSTAEVEGFSRLLWGLAPYMTNKKEFEVWDAVLEGLQNGTNPDHREYWGDIHDYDQRIVEMSVYGYALALCPEKIWQPLPQESKERLLKWLQQINEKKAYDCNWLLFSVLVNIGFKNVGEPYDSELIENHLNRIEEFYIKDGWYSDGMNAHCDYYSSFAIHYYCLFYAKIMEQEDPRRSKLYKKRASLFAKEFIHWFAKDGSALPFGRSLTYRFSQVAFWSAYAFAEVKEYSYGVVKGIILNHLRWWMKQPIFDHQGLLTVGYTYPNLIMSESYNSPGSPYWAFKTFLIAALEDDHPFWKADERPLPDLKKVFHQKAPGMIMVREDEKNHILAFNSGHHATTGHTHTSAKYEKFVYSNQFGFSVPRAEWGIDQGAFDNMLALSEKEQLYRVKRMTEHYSIQDNLIKMEWKPWSNVFIKTTIIAGAPWHIRIHEITTERELDFAEGGFCLGLPMTGFVQESLKTEANEKNAIAQNSLGESGILSLYGEGEAKLVFPNPNTNLIHSKTVLPTITGSLLKGKHLMVSAVLGNCKQVNQPILESSWNKPPSIEVKNDRIHVYHENLANLTIPL
ncbi:DUF2264 domain-containing protein [Alkalihalobacillus trypoxylicola]|uniref:DUF2264 domain-containing protein n=1 Tax=Alkalihalobacillus trypoxylicola TaxID=519424 RepID=A0A162FDA3_9BACI|nr:DUF2264 domain-containing protein [Alkalihalobacillus trypoxylicola]KYG35344.1 hypothetical protein AZF04_02720 [Alkalihalobacillus trypoxylicola]